MDATAVVQLASFSEDFVFDSNTTPTDNVVFANVSVVTVPASTSDGLISLPADIVLTDISTASPSGELKFRISGSYGLDIAIDDIYRVITFLQDDSNVVTTFTDFNTLNSSSYSHLTNFLPQDWSYKTYTYTFLVSVFDVATSSTITTTETVTQEVYPNMNRHYTRIKSVVNKEIINDVLGA
jgi:hypothetical protein